MKRIFEPYIIIRRNAAVFIILSLTFLSPAHAQTLIKGEIRNSDGLPVSNAHIQIIGSYDGGISGEEGKFHFTTAEKGLLKLKISHLNYKTDTITIPDTALTYRSGHSYRNPGLPSEKFIFLIIFITSLSLLKNIIRNINNTPAVINMSLSWNYLFSAGNLRGVFVVHIDNILNRNPVYDYRFLPSKNREGFERIEISSPASRMIFFGIFFNIGRDRREEIINSYL